jgi:ADP-ribosylglycohydrolase
MYKRIISITLLFIIIVLSPTSLAQKGERGRERRISRQVLEDKIRGGWAGQMIGVSYGAPTEFRSNGKIIEDNLNNFMTWGPKRIENAINQDDLYVDMTFADVMDRLGLDATTEDYGEAFKNTKYSLWHANAAARRLLNSGIKSPMSGHPKYNIHANDIDFQIEADFIGLMTPGLPQESNRYCERVGRVMNYGDGLYGGMFVSGMYAAAFFETNARRVVEHGLATIPAESGYARIIRDVIKWSEQHPDDWRKTWQLIQDKWDKDDSCTGGALQPFNIDARLNGAYIALGMLYGKGDFSKTMDISVRSGQDSDCNPASAAGIIGVMLGYAKIPDEWKSGIPAIADKTFSYTNYSFNTINQSTLERAFKVIKSVGGEVSDTDVVIPYQAPKPAKLEQWSMGTPQKIIGTDDAAWSWKGDWSDQKGKIEYRTELQGKMTRSAGAEATLKFTGTAVVLVGPHSQKGGRADVYLNDKKAGEIDFYIVERTNDDSLWHIYGLKPGQHTLRIVTRDDADPRSKGKEMFLVGAITYR